MEHSADSRNMGYRERWPPGGLNQLVRAGDVKSGQVLSFGLFSSVFKAEGNVPPPAPHQGLYDFGEADVTLSQHEEDVSAFAEGMLGKGQSSPSFSAAGACAQEQDEMI